MAKVLVLYVFHQYQERVENFFNKCIFKDDNIDFMVISNNKNNIINVPDYVKTFYRDNVGFDFGGWSEALVTNNLYHNYEKFIFVNSSALGPFIPDYCTKKWTDMYLDGLKDNVKLFGSTINTCRQPLAMAHVQSYAFSMDKTTLQYLMDCRIFSIHNYADTFHNCIYQKEVLMSRKIIENNWNIGSLQSYFKGVDFTFKNKHPCAYNNKYFFEDDTMSPEFRTVLWNEYELVFIKGNRIHVENYHESSI